MMCQYYDPLQKYTSIEALYALVGGPYGSKTRSSDLESSSQGFDIPFVSDTAILDKFIALCKQGKGETANREKILWLRNKLQRINIKSSSEKIVQLKEVVKNIFGNWRVLLTLRELRAMFPQLSRMDSFAEENFNSLLINPRFTFIPFRTKDGLYYLFSRDGVKPSCVNLEDPLSRSRLNLTSALKKALEINPLEITSFVNRALQSDQILAETTIGSIGFFFCVREADGTFTVLNKIPPPQPCYIVDDGSFIFTPVMRNPFLMNLTIKVDASYIKLRNLTVYPRHLKIWYELDTFDSSKWISIGTGKFALLVDKQELGESLHLVTISREQRHKLISQFFLEAFSFKVRPVGVSLPISSEFIEETKEKMTELIHTGHKITTIFSPEGNLFVVAHGKPIDGCVKIVKKSLIVFGKKERCLAELGQRVVIGKGKQEIDSHGAVSFCRPEILKDAAVAQELCWDQIPHIPSIYPLKRFNNKKAGILMEYCEGDLADYREILSQQQGNPHVLILSQECRRLLIQVVDALIHMHDKGWIHGDVKLANMLYKQTATGQTVARLCDFGGTNRIPAFVHGIVATYPPPEFLQDLEEQKMKNISFPQVSRTPEGDAWAFGVTVFSLLNGRNELVKKLLFSNNSATIIETAKKIRSDIQAEDPVSLLIRGLLDPNPLTRMGLEKAKELLL